MEPMEKPVAGGAHAGPGVRIVETVRWGDMDALGHVNNTVFFQYCESARIAYFETLALDRFKERPKDGPGLVAASLNFRRQMRYPGSVSVEAHVTAVSSRSFTFGFVLRDEADGAVVADGSAVCVWVDYERGKALVLPDAMVAEMARFERNPALSHGGGGAAAP